MDSIQRFTFKKPFGSHRNPIHAVEKGTDADTFFTAGGEEKSANVRCLKTFDRLYRFKVSETTVRTMEIDYGQLWRQGGMHFLFSMDNFRERMDHVVDRSQIPPKLIRRFTP